MSDTPSYDPAPKSSSGGLPPALAGMKNDTLLWAQVGGAGLALIALFLPWYTASFLGTSISANGFDDGAWGFLALLGSVALVALGVIAVRNIAIQGLKLPVWVPVAVGAVLALISIIELFRFTGNSFDAGSEA